MNTVSNHSIAVCRSIVRRSCFQGVEKGGRAKIYDLAKKNLFRDVSPGTGFKRSPRKDPFKCGQSLRYATQNRLKPIFHSKTLGEAPKTKSWPPIIHLKQLRNGKLASFSAGELIRIWDVNCSGYLRTLGETYSTSGMTELQDGRLAFILRNKTIVIADVETGATVKTIAVGSPIRCMKQLKTGLIATSFSSKLIQIWDIDTGTCIKTIGEEGQPPPPRKRKLCGSPEIFDFSPSLHGIITEMQNGSLAIVSADTKIKVWDIESGNLTATFLGNGSLITDLLELSSGLLACSYYDPTIKIYDVDKRKCLHTLEGHKNRIFDLVELDSGALASRSLDQTVRTWDAEKGCCLQTFHEKGCYLSEPVELGNGLLATLSNHSAIKIWDMKTGQCLRTHEDKNPCYSSASSLIRLSTGKLAYGCHKWVKIVDWERN